jgi:hypothetical protein
LKFSLIIMNIPADISYTEELLRDAMELLEDMRLNMSSFDRARFWHLKKHFDQNEAISKDLRKALNDIDTTREDKEEYAADKETSN